MAVRAARLLLATLALAGPVAAAAQEYRELNVKKGRLEGDQYLAGATVDVHGRVTGDLTMAGLQAGLDGIVDGDVTAAGLLVHVGGVVGDDAIVLGGKVIVQGWVGDGLLVGGGEISLTRGTRVGGDAMLAGRRIVILGDVEGNLDAAGAYVEIDGDVKGKARIRSGEVVIGPKARLSGDLVVFGANPPRIAEGARVAGKVTVTAAAPPTPGAVVVSLAREALIQLGLLLLVGSWMLVAPVLAREAAAMEWRRPWFAETLGIGALVGLPIATVALALTLVGLPAAVGLASAWVLLVLAGYSTTAICLGAWLRARMRGSPPEPLPWERLAWTLAALLLLRAAAEVPWIGWLAPAGAILAGAGAVAGAAQAARDRAREGAGPPGPAASGV